jgi:hypothetical protein
VGMVNSTIVEFFLDDLRARQHFEALRRYFFMHSGLKIEIEHRILTS